MYSFQRACFLFPSFDAFVCSIRARALCATLSLLLSLSLAFSFIFIRNNYNKNKRTTLPMKKKRAKTIERAHYRTHSIWKSARLLGNNVPTIVHIKTDPDYYLFHSKQINYRKGRSKKKNIIDNSLLSYFKNDSTSIWFVLVAVGRTGGGRGWWWSSL